MAPIEHLYFHIPFCPKKCPYCCFYVEEGSRNKTTAFVDALILELEKASRSYSIRPKTLYFGGGTPTSLLVDQWEHLLAKLQRTLDLSTLEEWTVEANPATVRPEKAMLLAQAGVSRISLGIQSWNETTLKTLGRVHTANQAFKTHETLQNAGFPEINIDLMFSVPGQTLPMWESDLETTLRLAPSHVSAYCLTYEEDTEYFEKLTGGQFIQNEELDAQLFELTMERLISSGYRHYEISNYAQTGRDSKHNRAYWEGRNFLGFGPSAFSTLPNERTQNVCDTAAYTRRMLAGEDPVFSREVLTEEIRLKERIAFGLRMDEGLESAILAPWESSVIHFEELGLVSRDASRIRLTHRGKLLADSIAEAFV